MKRIEFTITSEIIVNRTFEEIRNGTTLEKLGLNTRTGKVGLFTFDRVPLFIQFTESGYLVKLLYDLSRECMEENIIVKETLIKFHPTESLQGIRIGTFTSITAGATKVTYRDEDKRDIIPDYVSNGYIVFIAA